MSRCCSIRCISSPNVAEEAAGAVTPEDPVTPLDVDRSEALWSIALKGFCMGSADVVPGVSGGTVAFITGIYGRLIGAVSAFRPGLLSALLRGDLRVIAQRLDLIFLAALGTGIVCALATFTRVIPLPHLIAEHPETVYAIFFGLILGASWTLINRSRPYTPAGLAALVVGFVVALPVLTAVPDATPDTPWFLALAGALALSAMILPGISGSFVLLMLGKYATVLDAVGHLNLAVLVPFGIGGVCGLLTLANLLSWLIARYERVVANLMVGILTASLFVIWPFQHRTYALVHGKEKLISSQPYLPDTGAEMFEAVVLAALALAVVVAFERLAGREERTSDRNFR